MTAAAGRGERGLQGKRVAALAMSTSSLLLADEAVVAPTHTSSPPQRYSRHFYHTRSCMFAVSHRTFRPRKAAIFCNNWQHVSYIAIPVPWPLGHTSESEDLFFLISSYSRLQMPFYDQTRILYKQTVATERIASRQAISGSRAPQWKKQDAIQLAFQSSPTLYRTASMISDCSAAIQPYSRSNVTIGSIIRGSTATYAADHALPRPEQAEFQPCWHK
jgi:hypothetical protein